MIIDQLAALAASGESETLEFKETTGTRREATMTVCAFLNQGGGQALFGVTLDGAVVGQQVSERTIEELKAKGLVVSPWLWTVGALEAHGEGIDQPSGVMGAS